MTIDPNRYTSISESKKMNEENGFSYCIMKEIEFTILNTRMLKFLLREATIRPSRYLSFHVDGCRIKIILFDILGSNAGDVESSV